MIHDHNDTKESLPSEIQRRPKMTNLFRDMVMIGAKKNPLKTLVFFIKAVTFPFWTWFLTLSGTHRIYFETCKKWNQRSPQTASSSARYLNLSSRTTSSTSRKGSSSSWPISWNTYTEDQLQISTLQGSSSDIKNNKVCVNYICCIWGDNNSLEMVN